MKPEERVKRAVKKVLNAYPQMYHHWPVQTGMGRPCLDCHGCFRSQYFAIETKAPGKKLTPRQQETKTDIEASGGKVFVIDDSTDDAVEPLINWLGPIQPGLRR